MCIQVHVSELAAHKLIIIKNTSVNICVWKCRWLFSSGPPVTGFQSPQLPVHCAVRHQIPLLHDPTSSFRSTSGCFPSVTRSLFAQATCYSLCILRVHTISICCFPCFVGNKQFCVSYLYFFFLVTSLLSWVVWRSLQITNKNIPGHSQSQCPLKIGLLIKNAELLPFSSHHTL